MREAKVTRYRRLCLPQVCEVRDWYEVLASLIVTFGLAKPIQVRRIPGSKDYETVRQEDHETVLALELLRERDLVIGPEALETWEFFDEIPIRIVD